MGRDHLNLPKAAAVNHERTSKLPIRYAFMQAGQASCMEASLEFRHCRNCEQRRRWAMVKQDATLTIW
jgi:hypothetical protein